MSHTWDSGNARSDRFLEDQFNANFKRWIEWNEDYANEAWAEHLSNMQDSLEHRRFVANSDDCREEFERELYAQSLVPIRTDYSSLTGLWFVYNSQGHIISEFPLECQAREYIAAGGAK